jgi:DNA-binding SARP family transcriptional activator
VLQVYISNLRRLLVADQGDAPQPIETQRPGYLIRLGTEQLDLLLFDELRTRGEAAAASHQFDEAGDLLRRALDLWRGDPLAGLPIGSAGVAEVSRLEMAAVTLVEQLAEIELDAGRSRQVLDDLQRWIVQYPTNERIRGSLMVALYRNGRALDAIDVYQQGREAMLELGLDPSKHLSDLEVRILNQDPSLDERSGRSAGQDYFGSSTILRPSKLGTVAALTNGEQRWPLERSVTTIGRLPDRHVVVLDTAASRRHAEIRREGDDYVLVDTGSANGTAVNGVRMRERPLAHGDVIEIGDWRLTFSIDSAESTALP